MILWSATINYYISPTSLFELRWALLRYVAKKAYLYAVKGLPFEAPSVSEGRRRERVTGVEPVS